MRLTTLLFARTAALVWLLIDKAVAASPSGVTTIEVFDGDGTGLSGDEEANE